MTSTRVPSSRGSRLALAFALVVFTVLGWWATERMVVISEELILLPIPTWRVISPTPDAPEPRGRVTYEPSCADDPPPRLLLSGNRPTLTFCAGGRSYPIMAAPQFTALYTLPLGLLEPLHGGDPFLVRKLVLPLGLLSIVLGFRLCARFAGERLAALAALGMAVCPCFILIHGLIQPFETLPWVWTLIALTIFLGCPELAPRAVDASGPAPAPTPAPSTARLALGALCVGLAILANIKAVFYVVPLFALALRLGIRVRPIRPAQWALMIAAGALALVPMAIPVLMDPSMRYAQGRGGNWIQVLQENLRRPQKVFEAVRDLVLMWSNFGSYFAQQPLNHASLAVAALVLAFVLADTARTVIRRRGCVVTAACGVLLVCYLGVVTLLYSEFPANYTPLHAVFGVSLGVAAYRLGAWLRPRLPLAAAAALVACIFLPFAWSSVETLGLVSELPFVANSHAERELTRYLVAHADPPAQTVTINLLAGGLVDAISRGRVRTLQAHALIEDCERDRTHASRESCLHDHFHALLASEATGRDLRVIFSASLALVRRRDGLVQAQHAALERAAADLGLEVRAEETFRTPRGAPAIELYRVGRPSPAAL